MSYGDPYRGSERWDRDRFAYERDRDRYADERDRIDDRDRYYGRERDRQASDVRVRIEEREREEDRFDRRVGGRTYEDDVVVRERERRVFRDEEPRYLPRRSPPRSPPREREVDRRIVIERDREYRSPSPPPRRPGTLLRRQSSLDTFDRRPARYWERETEREQYGPPARRDEFRIQPHPYNPVPIPLPRSRALPPPRRYAEREYYDEIKVSDPDYYGDEEFRAYPERVREREVVRTRERRRDRSPETRSSVRSSSRSSTITSKSSVSSSSGGTAVKSEYPKKGKTRIPARLVSKRAIMDLNYPYEEEGNTIIILKALGQQNIDDLLKLSEDYKKSELEIHAARSHAGDIIEERRTTEVFTTAPAPAAVVIPPPPVPVMTVPANAPVIVNAAPQPAVTEVVKTTVIRPPSPTLSTVTSTTATSALPVVVDARPREVSDAIPVGPLALATAARRPRSHSVDAREIRAEIRDLERSLARRERRDRQYHHHHSHSRERFSERDLVRAERLPDGQLVLFEERIEKVEEPSRGVRIEKDKKGRMSISVPKYR